jgi:hypothetical protein
MSGACGRLLAAAACRRHSTQSCCFPLWPHVISRGNHGRVTKHNRGEGHAAGRRRPCPQEGVAEPHHPDSPNHRPHLAQAAPNVRCGVLCTNRQVANPQLHMGIRQSPRTPCCVCPARPSWLLPLLHTSVTCCPPPDTSARTVAANSKGSLLACSKQTFPSSGSPNHVRTPQGTPPSCHAQAGQTTGVGQTQ